MTGGWISTETDPCLVNSEIVGCSEVVLVGSRHRIAVLLGLYRSGTESCRACTKIMRAYGSFRGPRCLGLFAGTVVRFLSMSRDEEEEHLEGRRETRRTSHPSRGTFSQTKRTTGTIRGKKKF